MTASPGDLPPRSLDRRDGPVVVGILLVLSAIFVSTPLVEHHGGFGSDGRFYGAMAGADSFDRAMARRAPYCWRVVTPALAAALPFPPLTSFRVLAFASTYLSLLVLYVLLRRLGFSRFAAVSGVGFYLGVFWTAKFSFFSPAYIDHQTQLLLLSVLLCLVTGHRGLMLALIVVGVLQKESLLALVAVVYVYDLQRGAFERRANLWYASALLAVPTAALLTARWLVAPTNEYSALEVVAAQLSGLIDPDRLSRMSAALFSGLGLLPAIIMWGLRPSARFLAAHAHWGILLLTGAVLLLGGVDKSRLFLYALPAIVMLTTHVVDDLRASVSTRSVVLWLVGTLGVHFYIGNYLTPMGSFAGYLSRMVPEHAAGATYVSTLLTNVVLSAVWLGGASVWWRLSATSPGARSPR